MASENTQTQDNSLIATTRALLDDALTRFEKGAIAVSFSGAEDVVLIDLIHRLGYAVDVLAMYLRHLNIASFLVEIGGEIIAQGKNLKSDSFWKVAIDDPNQGENRTFIQVITLENEALATSGNYRKFSIDETTGERWVHSINPKTGKAIPSNVLSVSVLAENCMKADAYATALMVMPLQQAKLLIEKQPSLEAYWILSDSLGKVKEIFSSGFLKEN